MNVTFMVVEALEHAHHALSSHLIEEQHPSPQLTVIKYSHM